MNFKKLKIPKADKTITRRFKWEDDIKKAEAEWQQQFEGKK